jgi:single-strand DNA-binding protein
LRTNVSIKAAGSKKDQSPESGTLVAFSNENQLFRPEKRARRSQRGLLQTHVKLKETKMKDLNKVILIGRLGNDPVRRETKNGTPVAHFSLATSRLLPASGPEKGLHEKGLEEEGQDEEGGEPGKREETVWHNIVVWGRQGEVCYQFLRKGRTVYVEGAMRKRSFTSKDGQQRVSFEVHADSVGFLGGLGGSGSSSERETETVENEVAAS